MAILFIFFIGETYFRLTIKADRTGLPGDFKVYNESRGWALRPGNYRYFNFRAFREVDFSINEDGLRNHKFSLALPANRERVTVLGDSFVFAEALNDGEHLTDQLQKLGEEPSADASDLDGEFAVKVIEVWNASHQAKKDFASLGDFHQFCLECAEKEDKLRPHHRGVVGLPYYTKLLNLQK